MNNIFREYDIRGIYEKELNEQIVKLKHFKVACPLYIPLTNHTNSHTI